MLKVVHLSTTPLVGAPGNQCRALNEAGMAQARWAVLEDTVGLYQAMTFALDLTWSRDREQIVELVQGCDLLHLHNFIDLDSTAFRPIDFRALWDAGKPMVRQFHSTDSWVARHMQIEVAELHACPIPKLVIAQYPERAYPTARLVRNLVHVPPRPHRPPAGRTVRVGYAPSRFNSAHDSRWDTKGYPETVKTLRRLQRLAARQGVTVELDLIEQASHAECLRRKALCDLFVDDLVTGSYHLNTLESLAMGVPCATWLDDRIRAVVREVTGGQDLPVVDVGLEDAAEVLAALCARPAALAAMGEAASEWMVRHWAAADVAADLAAAYAELMQHPRRGFSPRFDPADPLQDWTVRAEHDARWQARRRHWPQPPHPWLQRGRSWLWRAGRALRLAS